MFNPATDTPATEEEKRLQDAYFDALYTLEHNPINLDEGDTERAAFSY